MSSRMRIILVLLVLVVVLPAVYFVFFAGNKTVLEPSKAGDRKVVLYNWDDYTDESLLKDFEKETGIKVILEEYVSESESIAMLQSDVGKYDLMITSTRGLENLKMTEAFDLSLIPNVKNISSDYNNLKYDIPYLYGTTGLAINTKFVPAESNSWSILWDKKYKGRISLLESPPEVIGVLCFYTGVALKDFELPENLKKIEENAVLLKENAPDFGETFGNMEKLLSGEKWIVQVYSGDVALKAGEREEIKYILPKDGFSKWTDYFVLCAGAKNAKEAHEFINFCLRPENAAKYANSFHYNAPVKGVEKYMNRTCSNAETVYPSSEVLEKAVNFSGFDKMRNGHQRIFYLMKSE